MSITFPRAFPMLRFNTVSFDLELNEAHNPLESGRLESVEYGPPRWISEYQIQTGNRRDTGLWTAWLRSLKFSRHFLGRDPFRPLPLHYKDGLPGGFSGDASSWSINGNRDELTFNGAPAAFKFLTGDYVGFSWNSGDNLTLHEILADADADGSGVAVLPIEPQLPTWVDGSATCSVDGPACLMKIVPGSVTAPKDGAAGRISFKGRQDLVS